LPLHVFIVHFPLALILLGAAGDLVGTAMSSKPLRTWAGTLLILGAFAALLAFFTGAGAASIAWGRPNPDYVLIEAHSQWAGAALWPIVAAGALRAVWRTRLTGSHGWLNLAAALLSAVLIIGISASGIAIAH
jgi:uncharacterized membrane protein